MTTIESLPPELLSHIFLQLDSPPPVPQKLYDIPADIVNGLQPRDSPEPLPLKSSSLVNRRWRELCFPFLFRHLQWRLRLLPREPSTAGDGRSRHPPVEADLLRFLDRFDADRMLRTVDGLTVFTLARDWSSSLFNPPRHVTRGARTLWESVFSRIDPRRVTLVGDPAVMTVILGAGPFVGADGWIFDLPAQILQVSRSKRDKTITARSPPGTSPDDGPHHPVPRDLFIIRPWTGLLLNEGSFLQTYTTYEYHNYFQPTLLDCLPPLVGPSLESFHYISIFPTSNYFCSAVVHHLALAPNVYFQIVPRDRDFSRILDPSRLSHLDVRDPWMECDAICQFIRRALFTENASKLWCRVRRFEMDRGIDSEAWDMFLDRARARLPGEIRWQSNSRDHVLVRDTNDAVE